MENQFLIKSTERGHVAPGFHCVPWQLFKKSTSLPPKVGAAQVSFLKTPPSFSKQSFIMESRVEIASDTEQMVENDSDKGRAIHLQQPRKDSGFEAALAVSTCFQSLC